MNQVMIIITKIRDFLLAKRKHLFYALILIVGLTITYNFFKKDISTPPEVVVDYKEVQLWKDKYNREHATLTQVQLDKESFKKQVDSISKILDVKAKNISGVTSITTKTDTVLYPKLVYIDSLKSFGFSKKDNYLALSGVIRSDSSLKIDLGLRDTLDIVSYKKTKFFKTTYGVDVSNRNPYNHIVSGYSYSQSEKIKRFGIGPVVMYDPFNNKVQYGIGLQYNIIRF